MKKKKFDKRGQQLPTRMETEKIIPAGDMK